MSTRSVRTDRRWGLVERLQNPLRLTRTQRSAPMGTSASVSPNRPAQDYALRGSTLDAIETCLSLDCRVDRMLFVRERLQRTEDG